VIGSVVGVLVGDEDAVGDCDGVIDGAAVVVGAVGGTGIVHCASHPVYELEDDPCTALHTSVITPVCATRGVGTVVVQDNCTRRCALLAVPLYTDNVILGDSRIRLNVRVIGKPFGAVMVLLHVPLIVREPPDVLDQSVMVPVAADSVDGWLVLQMDTTGTYAHVSDHPAPSVPDCNHCTVATFPVSVSARLSMLSDRDRVSSTVRPFPGPRAPL
jgi:hypothetical protein